MKPISLKDTSMADLVLVLAKAELGRDRERNSRSPSAIPIATKAPEARHPDTFDGNNKPNKLRKFLQQRNLDFFNHPTRFPTDRAKYAGSYLSVIAADWSEPFTRDTGPDALTLDSWLFFQD